MTQEKDLYKWHGNLFGGQNCKQPQGSSSSSIPTMEEDIDKAAEALVSLVTSYQEGKHNLPPHENLRDYILEYGEPLKKVLTNTDVNVNQNRIFLKKEHVEKSFLPLLRNDENIEEGIRVCAYDMHDNSYTLMFKKWTKKFYVLNGEWKKFFQIHELQKNDVVTVWIFRHSKSNKVCFALAYQKIER
ncbi:hypothetical protein GLYMA_04G133200v4 [Glycine max]|uniref:TF-B3 domain-containing protein n=1 Tax=Glycine max TaxID=3847 RepID=I1JW23_SOYBN|nr:putative B3 domain-containing protein At4g03170 [Glycine max]KAG5034943.1 hypothetical protein JHK87_009853 [Glycine soja]KAH1111196.1 hypothetical protein GYH30_009819 [Glycine max]KAH1253903.1 putative B3 domain-containing protein [Glycine max]KRH62800.1 hypothetical protein GLYMA_04G133200v4 [Glycine max]